MSKTFRTILTHVPWTVLLMAAGTGLLFIASAMLDHSQSGELLYTGGIIAAVLSPILTGIGILGVLIGWAKHGVLVDANKSPLKYWLSTVGAALYCVGIIGPFALLAFVTSDSSGDGFAQPVFVVSLLVAGLTALYAVMLIGGRVVYALRMPLRGNRMSVS